MLQIIGKRKIYYSISGLLLVASVVAMALWGLRPGIDFTGGSLLEISFKNRERPTQDEVAAALASLEYVRGLTAQPSGDRAFILRFNDITEEQHQAVLERLRENFAPEQIIDETDPNNQVEIQAGEGIILKGVKTSSGTTAQINEERFDSIGPSIGAELKTKSFYAVIIVIFAIIAYVAWAFRQVGRPVPSWKYGVIAVLALVHDVIITCGVFAVLGHYFGIEVNSAFIAAVLTILGYSVNDTIVVFDRIRENLHRYQGDFGETINISINETIVRSINTSLTVMLTLLAIFFFGGESIKYFALALIVGIFFGTYSSIFIASPLLVTWQTLVNKKIGK
ncbi:protein translocase subunit SecF [Candidatus Falkowbacteria bacterium]|nr:protein translocase subunit SecF [Candidatus Falkowbacteria bacterium]